MKALKFDKKHIPLIISGEKTSTFRLFDDKDLKEGDTVMFLGSETQKPFAKVLLLEVKERAFRDLTEEDKKGHEEFKNNEEMLKTYSDYYKTDVTPDILLKLIRFKILEKF